MLKIRGPFVPGYLILIKWSVQVCGKQFLQTWVPVARKGSSALPSFWKLTWRGLASLVNFTDALQSASRRPMQRGQD